MYVCICVYIYIYTYMYLSLSIYLSISLSLYIYIYTYVMHTYNAPAWRRALAVALDAVGRRRGAEDGLDRQVIYLYYICICIYWA